MSMDLCFSACERHMKHAYVQDIAAPNAERMPIKTNNFRNFYFINCVIAKKNTYKRIIKPGRYCNKDFNLLASMIFKFDIYI